MQLDNMLLIPLDYALSEEDIEIAKEYIRRHRFMMVSTFLANDADDLRKFIDNTPYYFSGHN